jgi:uncharacterized protein YcaQ
VPSSYPSLDLRAVRRLALARAGLLPSAWTDLPSTARGAGPSARAAAHAVVERFGYLQLDTISAAGARSHALVLASRLDGLDASLGEKLLVPGAPLFEYWGHAACWMPMSMWPLFEFRRRRFRKHPWWGDLLGAHRAEADEMLRRTRDEGPFRSSDLEGERSGDWWGGKHKKRVAEALWSAGELAIRERRGFQRIYDLPERVIPDDVRAQSVSTHDAFRALILLALDGHGWADAKTIATTFNLRKTNADFVAALRSLVDDGSVVACALAEKGETRAGWIRPRDLGSAERLSRIRPRADRGVLLSPFDPVLWDRARVKLLFGFEQVLEIYVPEPKRRFGYYVMPVLAGERLVARVDVRAERAAGRLRVVATHFEGRPSSADREAVRTAVARHARATGLAVAETR